MNAETLEALNGSIDKWNSIRKGKGIDRGASNCPLCNLYYKHDAEGRCIACRGCPVMEKSGLGRCLGTPYHGWVKYQSDNGKFLPYKVFDEKSQEIADDEWEFLKGLLPKEKE